MRPRLEPSPRGNVTFSSGCFRPLTSSAVEVGETPALICVEEPRQHQHTNDSCSGIDPAWRGRYEEAGDEGNADTRHCVVENRNHARRRAEKREYRTGSQRR